ncbi:uncharacterized protein LOC117640791 isoform X2 [Thrips palmi]|uniref:Uncharacterized protein LOC117640791 isoform X2 n=1 Tax=Thrips palmi TaxID=161013 RepID=A0A6P8YBC8_THRPL|nr:uncharacterized protein LOC117640791 isoform X2 [Thrips palmi]
MGNYLPTDQVDDDAAKGIGPCGKGDPNDFSLTHKEIHISIPKYQKIAAEMFKCYQKCADDSALPMYSCSDEINKYVECVRHWSTDLEYRNAITAEYLVLREEYRKTGRRRLYRGLKGETYVTLEQLTGFKV